MARVRTMNTTAKLRHEQPTSAPKIREPVLRLLDPDLLPYVELGGLRGWWGWYVLDEGGVLVPPGLRNL